MSAGAIEHRRFQRRGLKGKFPLQAVVHGHKGPVLIHGMDASAGGLGALVSGFLAPGTRLIVELSSWKLRLEVAWCQPEPHKHNFHRCGLRAISENVDLIQLLERAGCELLEPLA